MIGKIGENDKDILTDYIEILKLGKMSSKSYRYNVDKNVTKEIGQIWLMTRNLMKDIRQVKNDEEK